MKFMPILPPLRRDIPWPGTVAPAMVRLQLALQNTFDKVHATDASAEQIRLAYAHDKVDYRVEPAENVSLDALQHGPGHCCRCHSLVQL